MMIHRARVCGVPCSRRAPCAVRHAPWQQNKVDAIENPRVSIRHYLRVRLPASVYLQEAPVPPSLSAAASRRVANILSICRAGAAPAAVLLISRGFEQLHGEVGYEHRRAPTTPMWRKGRVAANHQALVRTAGDAGLHGGEVRR